MNTSDIPTWAAWQWFYKLLNGKEKDLNRAELIAELRTIHDIISSAVQTERYAYWRMMDAYKDLTKYVENNDSVARYRSYQLIAELQKESRERLERQTEDKIPPHWKVGEE